MEFQLRTYVSYGSNVSDAVAAICCLSETKKLDFSW